MLEAVGLVNLPEAVSVRVNATILFPTSQNRGLTGPEVIQGIPVLVDEDVRLNGGIGGRGDGVAGRGYSRWVIGVEGVPVGGGFVQGAVAFVEEAEAES